MGSFSLRMTLGRLWRPLLAAWRRMCAWDWDKTLQRTAHASQFVLVLAGIWGYFYTVRPINQKEELEEAMVKARQQVAASLQEAAQLQKGIRNYTLKIQGLERARSDLNEQIRQAELKMEQANDEITKYWFEREQLIADQDAFKKRMAAERKALNAELLAERGRAASAEQRVLSFTEEKRRMEIFNTLRNSIIAQCMAPSPALFYELTSKVTACISATARSMNDRLSTADIALIAAWAEREIGELDRNVQAPQRHSALGRLIVDQTFDAATTCPAIGGGTGESIEIRRSPSTSDRRCIGTEHMSDTIGRFVARYGGLQSALEATISGAAERRDPAKSFVPMAPTSISVQ